MLLSDITALRAPSGWEDEARNAIRREAEEILKNREGRVYGDTMGNLYAFRKGTDSALHRNARTPLPFFLALLYHFKNKLSNDFYDFYRIYYSE